jgi:hypothetical protein
VITDENAPLRRRNLLPGYIYTLTGFIGLAAIYFGWKCAREFYAGLWVYIDGDWILYFSPFDSIFLVIILLMALNTVASGTLLLRLRPAVQLSLIASGLDLLLVALLLFASPDITVFIILALSLLAGALYIRALWRVRKLWKQSE